MKIAVYITVAVVLVGLWQSGALRAPLPCEEPIVYSIGTFDRRFNISYQDLEEALQEAEAIWEETSGRDLFVYDPQSSDLPVNFIYDTRQEVTDVLSELENVVESDEETYHELELKYGNLLATYEDIRARYDTGLGLFQSRSAKYERDVQAWNSGRRNNKSELERLQGEKEYLESRSRELQNLAVNINSAVDDINYTVEVLNNMAEELDLKVDTYNKIGGSRGETFTGGLYYETEEDKAIDIYEFATREKLIKILVHELGHALGLEHNNDSMAIMYYLNKDENTALTDADLLSLSVLCSSE